MPKTLKRNRPWQPDDDVLLWRNQSQGVAWLAMVLFRPKSQIRDRLWTLNNDLELRAAMERQAILPASHMPCDPLEMNRWYAGLRASIESKQRIKAERARV